MIPESGMRPIQRRQEQATDEELVHRAVTRPESRAARQAASELLRRYQERVYIWCYRFVRNHDQALDLAQDVLLQAYRRLASFRSEARFSSWLFAVARNRCLSHVRSPRLLVDEDVDLEGFGDPQRAADRRLEEEQDEEALLQLIQETLEPREQEALWLRCVEKLPVDEITRLLGIESASGARGLLQKARRKLRAKLDERSSKRG